MKPTNITYFRTPADLRQWFAKHHATATEMWIGYYKKGSGKPSVTWPESVDEALCVGWIDGIRKTVDDERYTIRFTPRRRGSVWSAININRVAALSKEGRMRRAGVAAFEGRLESKSRIYAYEQRSEHLPEPYTGMLRKNAVAWQFFEAQPPSYRKLVSYWISTAKKEETRLRRLARLIDASSHGKRL